MNEELKKNATKNGLKKANYNMVKELMADDHSSNLIYAYSGVFTDIEGDLQSLLVAESVFRNNSNFNVYLLDHDKNDLDSYYHDQLPYLILTSPTNNH